MTAYELISTLRELDVRLWSEGDRLRFSAPPDAVTPDLRQQLKHHKAEILQLLEESAGSAASDTPLKRVSRDSRLPLTSAQEAMWFLQQMDLQSSAYNRSKAIRITGPLDVRSLEKALGEISARHESLRTSFPTTDGQPFVSIALPEPLHLATMDLRALADSELDTSTAKLLKDESEQPFDLSSGPLFRTTLLRLRDDDYVLLYSMHHIISDGWSGTIFLRELVALYDAYRAGNPSPLPNLAIQFVDFASWQNERLEKGRLEKLTSHWSRVLGDAPPVLEIPTYRVRPSSPTGKGASERFSVPAQVADRLRALGQEEGATLFMVLLAIFKVFLVRYTRQRDIIVGTPIAGRNRSEIQDVIGYFINSLAVRTHISDQLTFRELLGQVRESVLTAFANQDLPFDKLVEELHPTRDVGHHPVFQVMFVLQPDQFPRDAVDGLEIRPVQLPSTSSMFDLSLTVKEGAEGVRGSLVYKTDLFDGAMMERGVCHLRNLVDAVVANPERPIALLPMLDEADEARLQRISSGEAVNTGEQVTVSRWFERQVETTPNATALIAGSDRLSYRELNEKANSIAHRLLDLGVNVEDTVGICTSRSTHMIAGLLGILKAGAAYLPLDPAYPPDRLSFMVEDSGTRVILTQSDIASTLDMGPVELVSLDVTSPDTERIENPDVGGSTDRLAYVIYTSGSTGKPKGVEIVHSALVNFTTAARARYEIAPDDRVLQFASMSFDTAAEEIFPCLLGGATLVLRSDSMLDSMRSFVDECDEHRITVLDLPTAFWSEWAEALAQGLVTVPKDIRLVIIGGEAARWDSLRSWQKSVGSDVRLLNTYGPTEATVVATMCDASVLENEFSTPTVPIGVPLPNVQAYVLDANLKPAALGTRGRLFIGGPGLARGYRGRPELTEERFVANPLGGGRLYDTGDLAAFLPDGQLVFLGRSDDQVKVRGFRIELGEIESALRDHGEVEQAIVVVRDVGGDRQLVAYVVGLSSLNVSTLRRHTSSMLPAHMVPGHYVFLDNIPMTPNGKIDRAALPDPDTGRPDVETVYEGPRNDLENQLVEIWEDTLATTPIGVHDNFFDLGGHSLLAVRLLARVEKIVGIQIPIAKIFDLPTVAAMAGFLSGHGPEEEANTWRWLLPINPKGTGIPLFCVHGFAGSVFFFRHVSRHLGPDQPVYGLQSRVLDGEPIDETSVQEIAANYLEEVRTVSPTGPYVLTAHCAGGKIVLEMARLLLEQGEDVPMIILLDVVAPDARDELKAYKSIAGRFRTKLSESPTHLLKWAPRAFGFGAYRRFIRKPYFRAHLLVGNTFARLGRRIPRFFREHYAKQKYSEIARRYTITAYDGSVTIVRANESQDSVIPDDLGWKAFALGGLQVFDVPIAHVDMVTEEVVAPELLARIIRGVLRDLDGRNNQSATGIRRPVRQEPHRLEHAPA